LKNFILNFFLLDLRVNLLLCDQDIFSLKTNIIGVVNIADVELPIQSLKKLVILKECFSHVI